MDPTPTATTVAVDPRHVTYTHIMYALHAFTVVMGILTSYSIIGQFLFSLPSIIAVIMNYVRRSDVRDTWLASHFRWQLSTFWTAMIAVVCCWLLFGPLVLIFIGWPLLVLSQVVIGVWVAYRIGRGWLALKEVRTAPVKGF